MTLHLLRKFVFILVVLSQGLALAGPCEEVVFSDLKSYNKAMTERLTLREGQGSLMALYLKNKTPYPAEDGKRSLQDVLRLLELYPELTKPNLREQILEFTLTNRESPKSLKNFIRSFTRSAGQIRNNLFQISANFGFWMKLLDFRSPGITNAKPLSETEIVKNPPSPIEVSPPTQGKSAKKTLKKQQQEDFIKWLNTTPLNQETRDFIKDISQSYWKRTVTLYRALEEMRKSYRRVGGDNNPVVQRIGQAMADLVHTVGFGNEGLKARLKSINPTESYSAVKDILNERDRLAFDLGFEGHFKELKEALDSKIFDETKTLQQIHQDIQNQASVVKGKEVLRLRSLSLQESPFRACFGGDCSTESYFEKALDPNFIYFTLTDSQHRSFGQVTVVLGLAHNPQGRQVKTAFLDKIQGVSLERLKAMLEGIRLTLKEKGYVLAIPKEVGDPYTGLTNDPLIRYYVESKILPFITKSLRDFNPHKHEYDGLFDDIGHSRVNAKLPLLVFEGIKIQGVEIKTGPIHKPKQASFSLSVRSLYEPILALEKSTNEVDQSRFLSQLLIMRGIKELNISNQYVKEHLDFVLQNKSFSFSLRKKAFFTLLEDVTHELSNKISMPTLKKLATPFSKKEQQIIIGEMSNWKNTTGYRKQVIKDLSSQGFNSVLQIKRALDSPWGQVLDKGYMLFFVIDVFSKNKHVVNAITKALLDRGVDVNYRDDGGSTILMQATVKGLASVVKMLLKKGANVNDKNEYDETALIIATKGDGSNYLQIMRMLLDNGADVNAKTHSGDTALIIATHYGLIKSMRLLLNRGADINAANNVDITPLVQAMYNSYDHAFRLLVEKGADLQWDYLYDLVLHPAIQKNVRILFDMETANKNLSAVLNHPIFTSEVTSAKSASRFLLEKGRQIKEQNNKDKQTALQVRKFYEKLFDLTSLIQTVLLNEFPLLLE